ncbi:MAG: RNA 3'-terminal phosphate cyclase [Nitrospirota bacterium]
MCGIESTMIEIDGSYREGGGQILRTSLGLSCLFRKPFRIYNIRKARKKPGLMPQHLTAVRAAQLVSGAEVKGADTGSTELVFSPGAVRGGEFFFDIGTAGSTSLVLQTLIPALAFIGNESSSTAPGRHGISLKGGTHVPFSPSYNYLAEVFVPLLQRVGLDVRISIESYGFYPKGGGKIRAEILPVKETKSIHATERGDLLRLRVISGVGNLPVTIAERQRQALLDEIHSGIKILPRVETEILPVRTPGQGTFVFLGSEAANSVAGFASLGERGKRAEAVGQEAAREFLGYYASGAALDHHIPDQIVLYLALARGESVFTTYRITEHLMTNLWVISLFHEYRYSVEGDVGRPGLVRINPVVA